MAGASYSFQEHLIKRQAAAENAMLQEQNICYYFVKIKSGFPEKEN